MGEHGLAVWLGFTGVIVALLVVDLGVINRRSHAPSFKESLAWSGSLIGFALLFGGFLWWREGSQHALEFYTGYLTELSLSIDNLFVFIMIFGYFRVTADAQPKVLQWGILGAIVMRLIMIALGAALLARFEWIIYVFGGLLILTGIRMAMRTDTEMDLERNPVVRLARRIVPISETYDGANFFHRTKRGRLVATPLLLVVLVVEWSDVLFAIDSIPAIFAVTRDPFLVYSSNVFAILGLRALFFVLSDMLHRFVYLKPGVALILVYVGAKMVLGAWVHIPTVVSMGVILLTLGGAVGLSLWRGERETPATR